jgi:hypothetical protein
VVAHFEKSGMSRRLYKVRRERKRAVMGSVRAAEVRLVPITVRSEVAAPRDLMSMLGQFDCGCLLGLTHRMSPGSATGQQIA